MAIAPNYLTFRSSVGGGDFILLETAAGPVPVAFANLFVSFYATDTPAQNSGERAGRITFPGHPELGATDIVVHSNEAMLTTWDGEHAQEFVRV